MPEPNTSDSIRQKRKPVLISLSLTLLAVYALFSFQIWDNYQGDIERAKITAGNYAAIFETRLDATFRHADHILQTLTRTLPPEALSKSAIPRHEKEFSAELDARLVNFQELSNLRILDAEGKRLYASTKAVAEQFDTSKFEYFQKLRDTANAGLVFSEVFISENSPHTYLTLARALRDSQGRFIGAVTAEFDLTQYQALFKALDTGSLGAINLRRSDNHNLVTRWPELRHEINKPLPADHPIPQLINSGSRMAIVQVTAKVDGIPRIVSIHALESYPFYLIVGLARKDVLAQWRHQSLLVGSAGTLLLMLFLALLHDLWQGGKRESKALAELMESEQRLREEGERLDMFKRLSDNAGQGVSIILLDGTITYANLSLRQMLGIPLDADCSTYSSRQFFGHEDLVRLQKEIIPQVLQSGQWTGEINLQPEDGKLIPTLHNMFVIRNPAGKPLALANVLIDLRERQQMEERTRQLLAEMDTLLSNALVGIVHLKQRRIIYCNRRLEELFGYGPGELIGQMTEVFYATREDFERIGIEAYRVVGESHSYSTELTLKRKDGSLFSGALTGRAIDPKRPHEGSIWVYADITERLRAENLLRESEEAFRRLFEDVKDPLLLIRDGRFVDCNTATLTLLGYQDKAQFLNMSPADISPTLQPDGRASDEKSREYIATALQAGYHRFEWLHRRADGSTFPAEVTLTPITMGGEIILHTMWRDITERQAAETRLRLLAGVFEHSTEAILISDRHNRILEVNPSFSRLTGYSADDVRGQNPQILSAGDATPEFYRGMWESIRTHGYWRGEIRDRRKDGSSYPKWLSISTIRDSKGEIEYHIGSFIDISERKAAEEKISHLAHFDSLTDLPNRFNLQGRLEQALVAARREGGRPIAVMFLDLDRFKNVNDTLGHHIGDILLLEVSQRLAATVRESDVVARLGGDEFVVVLTGIELPYVQRVTEKILAALAEPYQLKGHELHTTASIGIAIYPDDGDRVDTLMQNADAAMYHAKSAGRNNAQFFTASMNEAVRDRHQLESDLHLALQRGELLLHYQPQIDANRQPIGAEALLRWQHPARGLVSPLKFIPLAEENGLILPIGHWVLETACQQILAWSKSERTAHLQLAVNVSARQFRQPDFIEQVREVVVHSGINPSCLKLELTESLVLDNVEETIRTMQEIKKLGVVFSMDDFGTGYSSLSYLARLPLDQLKIDRAFVAKLPGSTSDAIIAQTIITMGRSLGLDVIAEGVETEAQCLFLDQQGCHAYQGFLFSRPLPAAEFEAFLAGYAS